MGVLCSYGCFAGVLYIWGGLFSFPGAFVYVLLVARSMMGRLWFRFDCYTLLFAWLFIIIRHFSWVLCFGYATFFSPFIGPWKPVL